MERTVPFLHGSISLVAFVISLTLIVYMLITFVAGMFDIAMLLSETIFMTSTERQSVFTVLNGNFLYNIAILVVLMKANTVVTSYMRAHEVTVRQVVELGIIAVVLELTFNASTHSDTWQYVAAFLVAALFAIYAFRYHVRALIDRLAPESIAEDNDDHSFDAVSLATLPVAEKRSVVRKSPVKQTIRMAPAVTARPVRKVTKK